MLILAWWPTRPASVLRCKVVDGDFVRPTVSLFILQTVVADGLGSARNHMTCRPSLLVAQDGVTRHCRTLESGPSAEMCFSEVSKCF